jgi:hypothetical protein
VLGGGVEFLSAQQESQSAFVFASAATHEEVSGGVLFVADEEAEAEADGVGVVECDVEDDDGVGDVGAIDVDELLSSSSPPVFNVSLLCPNPLSSPFVQATVSVGAVRANAPSRTNARFTNTDDCRLHSDLAIDALRELACRDL